MRKTATQVTTAFLAGNASMKTPSLWTDGATVYSYQTAIATRAADGLVLVNDTRYTITTSNHQTAVKAACNFAGREYVAAPGRLPIGATAADIHAAVQVAA